MRRSLDSRRWLTNCWSLALLAAIFFGLGARPAQAKKMTLPELLELARQASPGIQAAAAATSAMEAQVSEARRNWLPQGDLLSLLAPSPNMHCYNSGNPTLGIPPQPDLQNCIQTENGEARLTNVSWARVFTRTEVRLVQ